MGNSTFLQQKNPKTSGIYVTIRTVQNNHIHRERCLVEPIEGEHPQHIPALRGHAGGEYLGLQNNRPFVNTNHHFSGAILLYLYTFNIKFKNKLAFMMQFAYVVFGVGPVADEPRAPVPLNPAVDLRVAH